jgi:hypothetical protein
LIHAKSIPEKVGRDARLPCISGWRVIGHRTVEPTIVNSMQRQINKRTARPRLAARFQRTTNGAQHYLVFRRRSAGPNATAATPG